MPAWSSGHRQDAAATGLVPRQARALQQQHPRPPGGPPPGRHCDWPSRCCAGPHAVPLSFSRPPDCLLPIASGARVGRRGPRSGSRPRPPARARTPRRRRDAPDPRRTRRSPPATHTCGPPRTRHQVILGGPGTSRYIPMMFARPTNRSRIGAGCRRRRGRTWNGALHRPEAAGDVVLGAPRGPVPAPVLRGVARALPPTTRVSVRPARLGVTGQRFGSSPPITSTSLATTRFARPFLRLTPLDGATPPTTLKSHTGFTQDEFDQV